MARRKKKKNPVNGSPAAQTGRLKETQHQEEHSCAWQLQVFRPAQVTQTLATAGGVLACFSSSPTALCYSHRSSDPFSNVSFSLFKPQHTLTVQIYVFPCPSHHSSEPIPIISTVALGPSLLALIHQHRPGL